VRAVPDPVAWYERVTGKRADRWQAAFVRSEAPASLLVAGRQVGKTEAVAGRATYRALFWPRRVGVLSPTLRQSSIVYRRCKGLLLPARGHPQPRDGHRARDAARRQHRRLPRRPAGPRHPRRHAGRPDRGRGRLRPRRLITAASPTLATRPGATLTMLGTPAGQRGKFHEEWARGEGWERTLVRSDECPRITAAFLARERRRLGPMFAQEYEGAFLSAPGALFAAGDLEAMFSLPGIEGVELLDAPRETELRF
jgi:hypothetical protein